MRKLKFKKNDLRNKNVPTFFVAFCSIATLYKFWFTMTSCSGFNLGFQSKSGSYSSATRFGTI